MLKHLSHTRLIAAWFALVTIATAGSVVGGATATPSTWVLLLLISLMAPAISMVVWRGAPPPTAAEVLHTVREQGGR